MVVPAINDPNYQHGSEADFIHTENVVSRIKNVLGGTMMELMKMQRKN